MRQALLFLPGIDGTGRLLRFQPRVFEEYEVDCVAYPQDQATTYRELAQLGIEALEGSPGRLPGVIVTESFGGGVALILTSQRPDLVERLVLINTFAYFPRRSIINLLNWLAPFLPARPNHSATRCIRDRLFFAPEVAADRRDAWWNAVDDVPMSTYGLRFQMIAGLDVRPILPAIDKPALVLAAANDRVVRPTGGRFLARRLPRARLLQSPVGHAAFVHPRVDVVRWLADWKR